MAIFSDIESSSGVSSLAYEAQIVSNFLYAQSRITAANQSMSALK